MVKQVIWTDLAKSQRKDILKFWKEYNKSIEYSKKLDRLFRNAIYAIQKMPNIGRKVYNDNSRVKLVRDYQIFYEETEKNIIILIVWDGRQDPQRLIELLK